MTGIIPIRLNEDFLQKIKVDSAKVDVGPSTYCKNVMISFINGEFCKKSDFEEVKFELNIMSSNLETSKKQIQTLQAKINKGKHEFIIQNDKSNNILSSLELIKFELNNKNKLLDKSIKQIQALQDEKNRLETKIKNYEEDKKILTLSVENTNSKIQYYEAIIRQATDRIFKLSRENQNYMQQEFTLQESNNKVLLAQIEKAKKQEMEKNIDTGLKALSLVFPKLRKLYKT